MRDWNHSGASYTGRRLGPEKEQDGGLREVRWRSREERGMEGCKDGGFKRARDIGTDGARFHSRRIGLLGDRGMEGWRKRTGLDSEGELLDGGAVDCVEIVVERYGAEEVQYRQHLARYPAVRIEGGAGSDIR